MPGTPSLAGDSTKRRISTRAVKRKKFDDELVESSLAPSLPKFEKPKPKSTPEQKPPPITPIVVDAAGDHPPVVLPPPLPPPVEKKKPAKASKRSKKSSKVSKFSI